MSDERCPECGQDDAGNTLPPSPEQAAEFARISAELAPLFGTDPDEAGRRLIDWWFARPSAERLQFIRTTVFRELALAGAEHIMKSAEFNEALERRRAAEEQQKR